MLSLTVTKAPVINCCVLLVGSREYAVLDAQIDEMIVSFGAGVWECRVCGLRCKKGDMRRHVEAKAGHSFYTILN
jgi:hypothetical protein